MIFISPQSGREKERGGVVRGGMSLLYIPVLVWEHHHHAAATEPGLMSGQAGRTCLTETLSSSPTWTWSLGQRTRHNLLQDGPLSEGNAC